MKNLTLLLLCCAFLGHLSAQDFAYNFPGDFDSAPSAFIKKSNGRFLIAGTTGGPVSYLFGHHYSSKGYLLDWDAVEGLKSSKLLDIYGETALLDMLELPNGNMIATGWDNFCSDPNSTLIYLKCFDPAGNLLWTKYTDTIPTNPDLADINILKLAFHPGYGKVVQLLYCAQLANVKLIDPTNGAILTKFGVNDNARGIAVNPVNNKLAIIGKGVIIQMDPYSGDVVSKNSLIPNWDSYQHVIVDAAGTVWAITKWSEITKWPLQGPPITADLPVTWGGIQWVAYGSGYAEYRQTSEGDKIHFFDANFQLQNVVSLPIMPNFKVVKMYLETNTILLAGLEQHGPQATSFGSEPEEASSNLLIRRFGYDGLPIDPVGPDIAVTGISIEVPPVFTKIGSSTSWQITGGKFVLNIRNAGNIPVQEVQILSSNIGALEDDPNCHIESKLHYSLHLQNLDLAPGEEMPIFIDSLNIVLASPLDIHPWKLCFWAAAPNQRWDLDYNNDYACLAFWDAVPTLEPMPLSVGLRIFPNPATESIRIALSATREKPDIYRILSSSGQVLQEGMVQTGADELQADISELPSGVYFVETGGVFGRFVKL